MKTALVVQHLPLGNIGSYGKLLRRKGWRLTTLETGVHDLAAADVDGADLLVMLGGPLGVHDDADFPFLRDELRMIERRLQDEKPIFAVCLGAQLMARALGARVYRGQQPEVGWHKIRLTDAGTDSYLRHLGPDKTTILHWHRDTFDLPKGAVRLASTDSFENQAFSSGKNALAIQFHAEAEVENTEPWLIGHLHQLGNYPRTSPAELREDFARFAPILERQAQLAFGEWLESVGL